MYMCKSISLVVDAWGLTSKCGYLQNKLLESQVHKLKKWVFSLARMLTTLRCCCLQLENMDQIIIVVKNWPNDLWSNCKPNLNFKQYLKAKGFLVEVKCNLIGERNFFE
jgi:hypothetical protein